MSVHRFPGKKPPPGNGPRDPGGARKYVLQNLVPKLHALGAEYAKQDPEVALEFRHLADRMSYLYKRASPTQIAVFFGVAVGSQGE